MSEPGRHLDNGAEATGGSTVEERSQLGSKPILEWTRDDWQLWATGLSNGSDLDQAGGTPPRAAESRGGQAQPATEPETGPVEAKPEDGPVHDGRDGGGDHGSEMATEASPTRTVPRAPVRPSLLDGPAPERPAEQPPVASPPQRPGPVKRPAAAKPRVPQKRPPVQARTRLRSGVELMVLAVVVGVAVAGLVTFSIVVTGLLLRRALG